MDGYRVVSTVGDFINLDDCYIGELIYCVENSSFYIYNNGFVRIECSNNDIDDDPNVPKLI